MCAKQEKKCTYLKGTDFGARKVCVQVWVMYDFEKCLLTELSFLTFPSVRGLLEMLTKAVQEKPMTDAEPGRGFWPCYRVYPIYVS